MSDDRFFERLRADAAPLRREPDPFALARIRARIAERISPKPTVAQLLAAWFRPLALTLSAVAIAAAVALTTVEGEVSLGAVEIVMAGDTYVVE